MKTTALCVWDVRPIAFLHFSVRLSHTWRAQRPQMNERRANDKVKKKKKVPSFISGGRGRTTSLSRRKKTGFFRGPRIDKAAVPPLLLIPPQFYFERPAGRCITPTPATSRLDPRTPSCDVQGCGSRLPPNPNASSAEPTGKTRQNLPYLD